MRVVPPSPSSRRRGRSSSSISRRRTMSPLLRLSTKALAFFVAVAFILVDPSSSAAEEANEEVQNVRTGTHPIAGLHSPYHSMGGGVGEEDGEEGDGLGCPSYGCVLLPRDVAFDRDAKGALESVRAMGAADDDASGEAGAAEAEEEHHKGYSSPAALDSALKTLSSAGNDAAATLTLVGFKGGSMESQINQDRSFVLSPYRLGGGSNPQEGGEGEGEGAGEKGGKAQLLGVFDGHAKLGELVSQHAVARMPGLLKSKLASSSALDADADAKDGRGGGEMRIEEILAETFVELDRTAPARNGGGCTASVVLRMDDDVYMANAGDSRSFLAAYIPPSTSAFAASAESRTDDDEGEGGTEETERAAVYVLRATREDKPHLPDEKARVEGEGGTVMVPPPERPPPAARPPRPSPRTAAPPPRPRPRSLRRRRVPILLRILRGGPPSSREADRYRGPSSLLLPAAIPSAEAAVPRASSPRAATTTTTKRERERIRSRARGNPCPSTC
mmetsp:Transcript_54764/g.163788  ORF Transcript_54764/g.163788 Transcript_54764/m.163788 type:complete len:503 (-) Transcript_54764:1846-3354(-)